MVGGEGLEEGLLGYICTYNIDGWWRGIRIMFVGLYSWRGGIVRRLNITGSLREGIIRRLYIAGSWREEIIRRLNLIL